MCVVYVIRLFCMCTELYYNYISIVMETSILLGFAVSIGAVDSSTVLKILIKVLS